MSGEYLDEPVDGETGRTEMVAYAIARLAGKKPEEAAKACRSFVDDAKTGWGSVYAPKRREVFDSVERTLLDELP